MNKDVLLKLLSKIRNRGQRSGRVNTEVLLNAKAKAPKGRRAGRLVRIWVISDMQPGDRFRMSDGSAYVVHRNAGGGNRVERTNKIHGSKKEQRAWRRLMKSAPARAI